MNILVSNDDGLDCGGIRAIVGLLREQGHRVLVVAPAQDRSGVSNAISLWKGNTVKKIDTDTWTVDGTPADCVMSALLPGGLAELEELRFKPDALLAGINAGANLGTDIIYSGTAGAARQGSIFGVPSIALSLVIDPSEGEHALDYAPAAEWTAVHLEKLLALWDESVFINVNFPEKVPLGAYEMTFPAIRRYQDHIGVTLDNGAVRATLLGGHPKDVYAAGSDCDAVARGKIAISRVANQPVVR